jgi:2-pyrone-4,6-dicarboxylate lactonase
MTRTGNVPYDDVRPFAEAVIAANPHRVVWGTDWPHPSIAVPMPGDIELVELIQAWLGEPNLREAIFVRNPESLYQFDSFVASSDR